MAEQYLSKESDLLHESLLDLQIAIVEKYRDHPPTVLTLLRRAADAALAIDHLTDELDELEIEDGEMVFHPDEDYRRVYADEPEFAAAKISYEADNEEE